MSVLDILLYIILLIYTNNPVYLINEFIDGLQITLNPDTYLTPPQIITRHGYPAETYNIETPDGFILGLHRIPNGIQGAGNQYPVLFIHGYIDSSASWIAQGPGQALPYLLADQGYDVWMINTRGNTFSQSHANYTPMERAFWDFSFHEVAVYDLPTTIDFILDKTNHQKVFCIGHSAGNSEFYIMLSVLPQYNEKVIAQVSLAPYYHESNSIDSIAIYILNYLYWNTAGEFIGHDLLTKLVVLILTEIPPYGYNAFDLMLYFAFGLLPSHINWKAMPSFYSNYPAGTSVKLTLHMFQLGRSFSYFDYGPKENMEIYGATSPPKYNITEIHIPVRIYHSKLDDASSITDVESLYNKLPVKAGLLNVADPGFTHLDFLLNKNAKELLYDDVIAFVNDVTRSM
ncbi:lipase 1-like [Planococcus citri]|uniref:lipase 1-like n=1 Tax=Planococcus citri TaxID=170843 RepID=UPI0031F8A255